MTSGAGGWGALCLICKSSESPGRPCLQMALLPELAPRIHTAILLRWFSEAAFLRISAGSHSKENPRAHLTRRLGVTHGSVGSSASRFFPFPTLPSWLVAFIPWA